MPRITDESKPALGRKSMKESACQRILSSMDFLSFVPFLPSIPVITSVFLTSSLSQKHGPGNYAVCNLTLLSSNLFTQSSCKSLMSTLVKWPFRGPQFFPILVTPIALVTIPILAFRLLALCLHYFSIFFLFSCPKMEATCSLKRPVNSYHTASQPRRQ